MNKQQNASNLFLNSSQISGTNCLNKMSNRDHKCWCYNDTSCSSFCLLKFLASGTELCHTGVGNLLQNVLRIKVSNHSVSREHVYFYTIQSQYASECYIKNLICKAWSFCVSLEIACAKRATHALGCRLLVHSPLPIGLREISVILNNIFTATLQNQTAIHFEIANQRLRRTALNNTIIY